MSEQDDLRARLARLYPAPLPLDEFTSPRASELLERTMSTAPVIEPSVSATTTRQRRWRGRLLLAAAASVAILGAAATAFVAAQDDRRSSGPPSTITLALPSGAVAASCVPFDVGYLRDMSPAFAGTVMAADDEQVVLDVDRWYTGGDADRVILKIPSANSSAALDGVDFLPSQRYLVTAADGTVNGCGYSGPATAELQRAFDEAFTP